MCIAARRPRPISLMDNAPALNHHRQIMSSSASPAVIVQHNYHDHAEDLPPPNQELNLLATAVAPFPIKLHEMLNQVEMDGFSHVVSWQSHGRCFVIHRPRIFKEILPRYFPTMAKMASFQRQLNLYGFQRITQGLDKSAYYNEFFLRDRVFLTTRMQRTKVKGTGVRGKSNPDQEPNFYSMPFVRPQTMTIMSDDDAVSALPLPTVSSCSSMESSAALSSPASPQHDSASSSITSDPSSCEEMDHLSEWGMPCTTTIA